MSQDLMKLIKSKKKHSVWWGFTGVTICTSPKHLDAHLSQNRSRQVNLLPLVSSYALTRIKVTAQFVTNIISWEYLGNRKDRFPTRPARLLKRTINGGRCHLWHNSRSWDPWRDCWSARQVPTWTVSFLKCGYKMKTAFAVTSQVCSVSHP